MMKPITDITVLEWILSMDYFFDSGQFYEPTLK